MDWLAAQSVLWRQEWQALPIERQLLYVATGGLLVAWLFVYSTRLGNHRPLAQCLALSLLVHVILWGHADGVEIMAVRDQARQTVRVPIVAPPTKAEPMRLPEWVDPRELTKPESTDRMTDITDASRPSRSIDAPDHRLPELALEEKPSEAPRLAPRDDLRPPSPIEAPKVEARADTTPSPAPAEIGRREAIAAPAIRPPLDALRPVLPASPPVAALPPPSATPTRPMIAVPSRTTSIVRPSEPAPRRTPPAETPTPRVATTQDDPLAFRRPTAPDPLTRPVRREPAPPASSASSLRPIPLPVDSTQKDSPSSSAGLSDRVGDLTRRRATDEPIRKPESGSAGDISKLRDRVAAAPAPGLALAPAPVLVPATKRRLAPNRLDVVIKSGGSPRTEKAVADALVWLAAHQSEAGNWDSDGFWNRCPAGDQCSGPAVETGSDTGLTALSLLAFLGAGHTHVAPPADAKEKSDGAKDANAAHRETVRKGLSWLMLAQAEDGDLRGDGGRIYCHSMATMALTEALAMTKDERIKSSAQRAVDWLARAQHLESGGWRYGPNEYGDTSVFGWALLALHSAKNAGLKIPESTWRNARRWLPVVSVGKQGGLAIYRPGYDVSPAMTAEALLCRLIFGAKADDPALTEASAYLLERLPDPGDIQIYYWYYGTLAMFQVGGPAWARWNDRITSTLLDTQEKEGHRKGSWAPHRPFGVDGGRVFSTAASALCLEIYYRYLPTFAASGDPSAR